MQVEESKEASLGGFVASKSKEEDFLDLTTPGRYTLVHGRVLVKEEQSSLNLSPMFGKTNLHHTSNFKILLLPWVPTSIVGVAWKFWSFLRVWKIGEDSQSFVDSPPNIRRNVGALSARMDR
ncbi:hypothetical protein M9H77_36278 [Catharanthus roseus]|uniref:Uncharacterized protein n=1 Tax=Catharanthus roseus TaxID=4058 RepID=A0ACB9ZTC5_CATRO|nr:hypothetical protein M9H77_36278 [Catharanthus roseus]